MNIKKFLVIISFLPLLGLTVYAFQANNLSLVKSGAQADKQTAEDELNRHLSAAETFQLSGDLENAAIENQAIVRLSLERLGNLAIKEGNFKRAVELLNKSLENSGDNTETRTNLAIAYTRLSEIDNAIEQARAAIDLDAKNARAHLTLGKLFILKNDFNSALPELERSLIIEPDFDTAYTLGLTYLQLKQIERARLLFEEIQQAVKPTAGLHILFGRAFEEAGYYTDSENEFKKALAIDPKTERAHFFIGYLILQHGGSERLPEAAKEFDAELQLKPQDFYSNFFRGVVANVENEHDKAVIFLQKAAQLKPDTGETYLFLGQSQGELGNTEAAEKNLRRSIELTKDASNNSFQIRRAHFLLGRVLLKTGRKTEAEKELALARQLQGQLLDSAREEVGKILGQVVNSDKTDASIKSLDDRAKTEKITQSVEQNVLTKQETAEIERIKSQLVEILAQAFHNLGVIAAQKSLFDDAIAEFAAAAEWKPDFPGLDRNWGIISFNAKQFDKAIAPLSRHVKAHADDVLTRRMLGVSYYFNKNYKLAAETLKPLEATIASDPELAYFYGISLVRLEKQPEAAVLFARLAEQNPKDAQAQFYAGQGFVLVGDLEKAVKEFRAAAALDANLQQAHYSAGQTLIRLNRLDDAEKEFRQELAINPNDEQSKYSIAYTLLERKTNTDEALQLLREAIAIRYDYADARYQLGKALIEKGEIAEAIEQLENAANSDPKKDFIHYQLSIAYRRANRAADADRELKLYRDLKDAEKKRETSAGMGAKSNAQ